MSYVNEASWDRVARVVVGAVLAVVGFVVMGGVAGTVVGVVGLIPLLTGASGYCPLYQVAGFRTNHADETASTGS